MVYIIIIFSILIFALVIYSIISYKIKKKYKKFVLNNSIAILKLKKINDKYKFYTIENSALSNYYDNTNFYDLISPKDYLIYNLVYMKNDFYEIRKQINENIKLYNMYKNEIKNIDFSEGYICSTDGLDLYKLKYIENEIYDELLLKPTMSYNKEVILYLTKINGVVVRAKREYFSLDEIENLIKKINLKKDDFYLDKNIWDSISKVERGKVSNKLRFYIFNRDGNKCKNCGNIYNLEIDHIIPISKGGKSVEENLQTLCCFCNKQKSNNIVDYEPKFCNEEIKCPKCGGILIEKKGKNGRFYGCINFPSCNYTRNY